MNLLVFLTFGLGVLCAVAGVWGAALSGRDDGAHQVLQLHRQGTRLCRLYHPPLLHFSDGWS